MKGLDTVKLRTSTVIAASTPREVLGTVKLRTPTVGRTGHCEAKDPYCWKDWIL